MNKCYGTRKSADEMPNDPKCAKIEYLLRGGIKVVFGGHHSHSPKMAQDPDVGNVEFGKEPVMIRRPVFHFRMSAE